MITCGPRGVSLVSWVLVVRDLLDVNYDGDPNVVVVYVSFLRRRLDTPFGRRTIEPARGMGDRLAPDGG